MTDATVTQAKATYKRLGKSGLQVSVPIVRHWLSIRMLETLSVKFPARWNELWQPEMASSSNFPFFYDRILLRRVHVALGFRRKGVARDAYSRI